MPDTVTAEKTGDGAEHTFHLFVQPKDDAVELWEGARSGVQAAEDFFNADQVLIPFTP
jgi:intermediate cleaving peptidase 55